MTCECYKIGGPFIAEDTDCPIHGSEGLGEKLEAAEAELVRLRSELQEARDNALEEAATVAETLRGTNFRNANGHIDWRRATTYEVAAAIRQLKGNSYG